MIDPCIPPSWQEYTVEREFRGSRYRIRISNPNGASKGVTKIIVDGRELPGSRLPLFADGQVHLVEVTM